MSTPTKKPPPGGTNRSSAPTQKATSSSAASQPSTPTKTAKSSAAKSSASQMAPGASGVSRVKSVKGANGSPLSARAAVKKPGSNLSPTRTEIAASDPVEDDSRLALIDDLKQRLQSSEALTEDLQKQISVLQARLDESIRDQSKLEERVHEEEERNEGLENEKKELVRQRRELDSIYEAERAAMMKEKEESQSREDDMQETIQRLKDSLSQRDLKPPTEDGGRISRTASFQSSASGGAEGHFAPSASIQRSNSRNNSKILLQKDKVIESLRLELAEVQIKLVEMENMGGGRVQELEKALLEARMTNARLMEDNESFQLLLSEMTISGDIAKGDFLRGPSAVESTPTKPAHRATSLADELESADDDDEVESDKRRLESEVQSLKEQNKALTLYINKIIDRVLQHKGYESILGNAAEVQTAGGPNVDKDLPPPPPTQDATAAPSLLQRAKSVAMGATTRPRPRPVSYMPPSENSINSDPTTAPSIPFAARGKASRVTSADHATLANRRNTVDFSAASVVHSMFRASSPDAVGGPGSPAALTSPRNSFFAPPVNANHNAAAAARIPSSGAPRAPSTDRSAGEVDTRPSTASDSGQGETVPPSPPRSIGAAERTMTGKGIKPLRLVQENAEAEEAARKAANRGSWINMGWFQRGQGQGPSE